MASSSFRGGSSFYNSNAAAYRSREGLSTRPAAASDEIQLQIDPMQGDLDDEIVGLHSQVKRLRNIAQDIGTEAKSQQDFLDQLQMTLIKAQAGVKNNVRRLNKKIIQNGSNHVVQVVVFALICFFIVYMWSKISRR
ncbi:bet1-like protein At1g29060 [Benincasa hispida]|uniref:bet1-like protein At1g29060 n=1 Tax=Benincasa hispida TaxID=102211 RepID=UPI0018FF583A|nr:bet1-like protein At1g29060 [Benincasa hispida]